MYREEKVYFGAAVTYKYTLAAFVDLRKTFDTVNHDILIYKLHNLGLHENTINWLRIYLKDRKQNLICLANNVQ